MIDVALCVQSAAAYDLTAPGRRIQWQDMSALLVETSDGFGLAIEGTDPSNILNLIRDGNVCNLPMVGHPALGPMVRGAAEAAEGFFALLAAIIGQARLAWITGHSLGGQVAVSLAALMALAGRPPLRLVVFDPPKSGGPQMAAILDGVPGIEYTFNGSIVSHWPFFECQPFRQPPVMIGDYTSNPLEAHSISRALAWMQAH